MNNIKKAYYKQHSDPLTLQEILTIVAHRTGSNPKLSGKNYKACCPSHDDKHASLSITAGDDGRILFFCFAGCTVEEICSSLGIKVKDLFPKCKGNKSYE